MIGPSEGDEERAAPPVSAPLDVTALRRALDPNGLARALEKTWRPPFDGPPGPLACSIDRLHPHRDGVHVLDLTVRARGTEGPVLGRFFAELAPTDVSKRYSRALARLSDDKRAQMDAVEVGSRLVLLEDLGLLLRARGLDERIYPLGDLDRPWRLVEDCADPDVGRRLRPPITAELLSHRYNKRCVIRVAGSPSFGLPPAHAIVKLYKRRAGQAAVVADLMRNLSQAAAIPGSRLQTPNLYGELRSWPGHLMEDVGGTSLDAYDASTAGAEYRLAGRLIAAFHAAPVEVADSHDPDAEIALIAPWVALAGAVFPGLATTFVTAESRVRALLDRCRSFPQRLIHRDFHEKQVLLRGGRAILIDFDTVTMGDAAQDLGNFLAHLDLRELHQGVAAATPMAAFLDGYGTDFAGDLVRRTQAHRAATLLRLACIYAFSTRLGALVPGLLGRI